MPFEWWLVTVDLFCRRRGSMTCILHLYSKIFYLFLLVFLLLFPYTRGPLTFFKIHSLLPRNHISRIWTPKHINLRTIWQLWGTPQTSKPKTKHSLCSIKPIMASRIDLLQVISNPSTHKLFVFLTAMEVINSLITAPITLLVL